jgi:hypothetical protein
VHTGIEIMDFAGSGRQEIVVEIPVVVLDRNDLP